MAPYQDWQSRQFVRPQPRRSSRRIVLFGFITLVAVLLWHNRIQPTQAEALPQSIGQPTTADPRVYHVGIQAGHWQQAELPDELAALVWDTGTSADGIDEWQVNLSIAEAVVTNLQLKGIQADLLPATIPIRYQADAFVTIHADGNDDPTVYGYKVAPSAFDNPAGAAVQLSQAITVAYGKVTSLTQDSTFAVSDDMTKYFAFNFPEHLHAITATTPGVIVEAGYISNDQDRAFLTQQPQLAAQGIADGIEAFLHHEK